jgi:hypothetical protein
VDAGNQEVCDFPWFSEAHHRFQKLALNELQGWL